MSAFNEDSSKYSAFQVDQFSDFGDVSHGDNPKNPFLSSSPDPILKKSASSPSKIFQKPAELIQASKSTRYDVFKNDNSNFVNEQQQQVPIKKDDPFQDFAKAAFSEFKVDKMIGHEFSNKLSGTRAFQQSSGSSKVILNICVVSFASAYCKNVSGN